MVETDPSSFEQQMELRFAELDAEISRMELRLTLRWGAMLTAAVVIIIAAKKLL